MASFSSSAPPQYDGISRTETISEADNSRSTGETCTCCHQHPYQRDLEDGQAPPESHDEQAQDLKPDVPAWEPTGIVGFVIVLTGLAAYIIFFVGLYHTGVWLYDLLKW